MTASNATRAGSPPLSLRAISTMSGVALASIALVACVALMVLTTVLRTTADTVLREFHHTRAVDTVREEIFAFGRASDLAYVSGDRQQDVLRAQAESELLRAT